MPKDKAPKLPAEGKVRVRAREPYGPHNAGEVFVVDADKVPDERLHVIATHKAFVEDAPKAEPVKVEAAKAAPKNRAHKPTSRRGTQ